VILNDSNVFSNLAQLQEISCQTYPMVALRFLSNVTQNTLGQNQTNFWAEYYCDSGAVSTTLDSNYYYTSQMAVSPSNSNATFGISSQNIVNILTNFNINCSASIIGASSSYLTNPFALSHIQFYYGQTTYYNNNQTKCYNLTSGGVTTKCSNVTTTSYGYDENVFYLGIKCANMQVKNQFLNYQYFTQSNNFTNVDLLGLQNLNYTYNPNRIEWINYMKYKTMDSNLCLQQYNLCCNSNSANCQTTCLAQNSTCNNNQLFEVHTIAPNPF